MMAKRVIVAALLGTAVMIVWTFLVNGILGFRAGIDMKKLPDERRVYEVLREGVVEPGRYTCNPEVTAGGSYPGDEPVFGILYSGMGHGSAGRLMPIGLVVFVLAPLIGTWMLSLTSDRVLGSYARKVLFFTAIGLLFALFGILNDMGIGGYPPGDAAKLAVHDVVLWTLVGLAVAWRIRPAA